MKPEQNDITEYVKGEIKEILPEYDEKVFEDIKLQPEEILFVYKYVSNNFEGVTAYKQVYGEDHKKALMGSKRLLARKDIQTAYNRLLDLIWDEACTVLPVQLLSDLNKIRDLDLLDYYDDSGYPIPLSEIPREKRLLINNIQIMLDKQGMQHYTYDLPDKRKVTSTMLEIIKLREASNKDKDEMSNDKEAQEMVRSIFAKVQATLPPTGVEGVQSGLE